MNSRKFYICSLRRRLTLRGIIGNVISSLNSFYVYMLYRWNRRKRTPFVGRKSW